VADGPEARPCRGGLAFSRATRSSSSINTSSTHQVTAAGLRSTRRSTERSLGREYDGVRRVLAHLDHFLATRRDDLTTDTFASWCLTLQHLASGTRRHRMQVVRNLCHYKRRRMPTAFIPDERLFPPDHQVVRPRLFTEAEVLRLLDLAKALRAAPTSPLRRENLHLAIVILYTTGLRLGELVRLTPSDYEPRRQTLFIRESKFHKSRSQGTARVRIAFVTAAMSVGAAP
jgi:integrase/recombinase XerD